MPCVFLMLIFDLFSWRKFPENLGKNNTEDLVLDEIVFFGLFFFFWIGREKLYKK